MNKQLDRTSVIPLYHQLEEMIRENVESDIWKPGDMIPSEHQFQHEFNVSRNTIKKAIENLVQDGVLNRIQGKGTYVSFPKIEHSLSGFYSFSKVLKQKGLSPHDEIVSINCHETKASIARRLQIPENSPMVELYRLRYASQEPMILETSYIPADLVPGISKERLENTSLYDLMEAEYGILVKRAKEMFEPVLIRDYESKYLKVETGSPALLLDRIAYDTEDKPVEFCRSIIRGDRCRFYTELL